MIDYYFPPLAGAAVRRTLGLVKHLPEFGWDPVVLTVHRGDHFSYDFSLLQMIPDSVNVQRTASLEPVRFARKLLGRTVDPWTSPGRDSRSGGFPWRGPRWMNDLAKSILFPDQRIGWLPFALARALTLHRVQPFEVVYSTSCNSITSHLIALVLKRLVNIPWVADFQDPWAEWIPVLGGRKMGERIENLVLQNADRVTIVTEPLRVAFQRKYRLSPDKLTTVLLGFDPDAFKGLEPIRRSKFTITYFGGFFAPRSPSPFLTALGQCVQEHPNLAQDIEVSFFGNFDAETLKETEALLEQFGLREIVRLEGIVPYMVGGQHLVGSDVLLLVTSPGDDGISYIPTKFFDYLAAGRPILALAPDGAITRLLQQANAGMVTHPSDIGAIKNAILGLYQKKRAGSLTASTDRAVISQWTVRELARRFSTIFDDVLGSHM